MKKVLLVAMCVLTLVCLCACTDSKAEFKKMAEVASAEYSQIDITIITSKGSTDNLTSTIKVTTKDGKTTVTYHLEEFTKITADSIPESYKTVREGVVEVVNGKESGDVLEDVSFVNAAKVPYSFDRSYFGEVKFNDGKFSAPVNSPELFTGNNSFDCKGKMAVDFDYTSPTKEIRVNYQTQDDVFVDITYKMS